MISLTTGNILEAQADALVNTVNCVGIMGRGIALQFKNTYPRNFRLYEAACKRNEVQPGRMFVTETGEIAPRFIINFPTKRHWKGKSRMEDVEAGLIDLVRVVQELGIRSIAIPPLGAGLGGLEWSDVRPRIEAAIAGLSAVETTIYEPAGTPDLAAIARNKKVPNMTAGRAALVGLMQRYLNGLMDPFVTLLEAQKLMFFMQEAGEGLRLEYEKGHYGPYSAKLGHVFKNIEGHLVSGYADGGDDPTKQLPIIPGAFEQAESFLADRTETRQRFDRVADLVAGFETPYGLELLATVYWVARMESAHTFEDVVSGVHRWSVRKRQFTHEQIAVALDTLQDKGWLNTVTAPLAMTPEVAPSATSRPQAPKWFM